MDDFRVAIVYGKSVKHQPQRVGLGHELADEDISKFFMQVVFDRILGLNLHTVTIVKR